MTVEEKKYRDINADQLRAYMGEHQEREYQLIDVRQPKEYGEAHIAGAILLPLGELSARLGELPRDRDIIFY